MIWINFSKWVYKCGRLFYWKRVYRNGKWTPFCHVRLYRESSHPETGPDWKISVPDGHAGTASIFYRGKPLFGIASVSFRVAGGERAYLELEISPIYLEALLNDLRAEIKVAPCE